MIFFKKKSKKSVLNENKPLPSPPLKKQQTYWESDSWLQLNLPDDFSSSIVIPQLHPKESSKQQVESSTAKSIANTIDTCSTTTTTNNANLYIESDLVVNTTISSFSSLKDEHCNSKPTKDTVDNDKADFESNTVEKPYIIDDSVNIDMSEVSLDAGDSLLPNPEGELKLASDNEEIMSSIITETNEKTEVLEDYTTKDEKDNTIITYSGTSLDEEELEQLEESQNTPFSGNKQLFIEQSCPVTVTEKETTDSSTLPLDATIIEDLAATPKEDGDYIELVKTADTPKNEIQQQSLILEARSDTVDSLEIASHQQKFDLPRKPDSTLVEEPVLEDNCVDTEVCLKYEENITEQQLATAFTSTKDNDKTVEKIAKRKSVHSLIPRKQQPVTPSVIENTPSAMASKLPVSSNTANTSNTDLNTNRRGSSGSFIPVLQQNRLSLTITENTANFKYWSPSSSSDSLRKSPSSIPSSTSTTSSNSSSNSNATTNTRKEKRSSIKAHHRLSSTNIIQQSKIPVVAATMPPISKDVPKKVPSAVSNMSRLPKRNPTVV